MASSGGGDVLLDVRHLAVEAVSEGRTTPILRGIDLSVARGEVVNQDGSAAALPTKEGALSFVPGDHPRAVALRFPSAPVRLQLQA